MFRKTNYLRFYFRYQTLDNLCLLSSQNYSHNHNIFQVTEGWANRIRIIHIPIVDITDRIHIPRIEPTVIVSVTRSLFQDYLYLLYN